MIYVVWNGGAGSAATLTAATVREELARATGLEVHVQEVSDERGPDTCARAAIDGGATIVVAAGGDGTVSAVAAALVGSTAHLGVLPLGTSNSFAAALGIPDEVTSAVAMIATAAPRPIDLAYVTSSDGRRSMVLHCMIGFHADAIANTTSESKRRWGVLAYAGSAMRGLANLETFAVELHAGAHVVRCRATAIAVANIAPIKTVLAHGPSHLLADDGLIDVTVVAAESLLDAIATGVHLYLQARSGEAATRANVGSFSTDAIMITSDPPQHVLIDGEPFGSTPVRIEILRHGISVLAPPAPAVEGSPIDASLIGLPDFEVERSG